MPRRDDLLMPDMDRIVIDGQPDFFMKFPAQGGKQSLTGLHAATRRCPDEPRSGGHSWMRGGEPAQQDTVVLVENDRPGRMPQVHSSHPGKLPTAG